MCAKQTGIPKVGIPRWPAVFSWDPSLIGVAKFARYACLAFEQFAFDVPRYWSLDLHVPGITYKPRPIDPHQHPVGFQPVRTLSRSRLEESIGTSLPLLGQPPDFRHLPVKADEAQALADINQIATETYLICHRSTVSTLTAEMGSWPGWHIYDDTSLNAIRESLLAHGYDDPDAGVAAYAQFNETRTREELCVRLAANTAYLYVARAIPHLETLPVDLVLEWRSALRDSLEAYRTRVYQIVERSWAGESGEKLSRLIEHIMYELDQEFEQVQREAKSQPLWRATREAIPSIAGTSAGIAIELIVGLNNPLPASLVAAGGMLGGALTIALTAARDERAMNKSPLYWRYAITKN
jgi:hypothetical protein